MQDTPENCSEESLKIVGNVICEYIYRKNYENKLAESAGNDKNMKPVFAYMKRKSKTKQGIGDICIDPNDVKSDKTSDTKEKTKIFSDYFDSVWTDEPTENVPKLSNIDVT